MANDFQRLKDEADISEVVDYLGLHVTPKGSAFFILCPNPAHNDKHPNNCYFKSGWNNVYCTVCHKAIQAIDLISYVTGASYGSAADTLWEIEGRPDWYYDKSYKDKNKKKEFTLSGQDAEFLGIHLPRRIKVPVSVHSQKLSREDLPKNLFYDNECIEGYLVDKVETVSWKDFMTEDEIRSYVLQKVEEKSESLKKEKKILSYIYGHGTNLPEKSLVTKLFREDEERLEKIRRDVTDGQQRIKNIA